MSFTTPAQVLQMLGGAMKGVPKTIFMEKKLASVSMALPLQNILPKFMDPSTGAINLAGMLQNPIGAISDQLNAAASSAATAVTTALGSNPFSAALGNLQTAVTGLQGLAGSLSGLGGDNGLLGMISHANIAAQIGDALPASLGIGAVVQPLLHGDPLTAIQNSVSALTAQVLATTITPTAAAAIITGHTSSVQGVHDASVAAQSGLQGITEAFATLNTAVAATIGSGSLFAGMPEIAQVMNLVVQPDSLSTLQDMAASLFPALPSFDEPAQAVSDLVSGALGGFF